MNLAPQSVRARSFEGWADEYERYRPGYPAALFDLIADRLRLRADADVVDVGAGTGKVARAAAARGWRVTAVDPAQGMLAVLRQRAAIEQVEIEVIAASAEATGLPSATFDVALAGEAYHWFDAPAALGEMARIVRPGGGISFFWNVIDADRLPLIADERRLVAELGIDGPDSLARPGPRAETRDAVRGAGAFDEPEFVQLPHVRVMTGDEYFGLAHTKSHLRTAPRDVQERFGRAFREMLATHGIGASDQIDVPYIVDCWIARRAA